MIGVIAVVHRVGGLGMEGLAGARRGGPPPAPPSGPALRRDAQAAGELAADRGSLGGPWSTPRPPPFPCVLTTPIRPATCTGGSRSSPRWPGSSWTSRRTG